MSLKACRRWDSTCDGVMVFSLIDELFNSVDLGHWDSAKCTLYSGSMDKGSFFGSILETRVFLSKGMLNFCT